MTRWDGESNESMYERCGMGTHANGVNYGVVEWVMRNTLKYRGEVSQFPCSFSFSGLFLLWKEIQRRDFPVPSLHPF